MIKKLLTILLCGAPFLLYAQNIEIEGVVSATGIIASEEENPFWFYTNSNATIAPETNFATTGDLKATYSFEKATVTAGAAFYYRDGVEDNFRRRDLYLQFKNNWLKATLGSKKQAEVFNGLSATNKNFLWSGNARPLAGLVIEANDPIKISETFSFDWGIGHYNLNDDRYVDDVRVHYKRLGLIVTLNDNNRFTGRIQHFAQWAGTSPDFGALPDDFNAFVDVFFAKKASEATAGGEVQNALGNHLGSYFLQYDLKTDLGDFAAYHEHPFEDGSGTRFANFPDGVWGIHFAPANNSVISKVLYEYIDTSDQSGDTDVSGGADGYFGNNLYRSGWTYEDRVIGLPFILLDPDVVLDMDTSKFTNNRSKVHHLGISGSIKKFNWKLKSTYATFLGTFRRPFQPKINRWSNYASVQYVTETYGTFTIFAGADTGNIGNSIAGGGLTYSYQF